ncbi:hypothetical protein PV325_000722 [Microctonus aethiopoides]|nr:hypothetical protein PV325_000722 [Microctonus aethiopoides]
MEFICGSPQVVFQTVSPRKFPQQAQEQMQNEASGGEYTENILMIIHVKFVDNQGIPSPELNSTINNLCDQLDVESDNRQLFSYENIFGLHGLHCPISKGDVKDKIDVIPFDWPEQHTFTTDLHCGIYDYQVTLSKCNNSDCKTLIVGGVKSYFSAEFCNDHEIVHENLDISNGPRDRGVGVGLRLSASLVAGVFINMLAKQTHAERMAERCDVGPTLRECRWMLNKMYEDQKISKEKKLQ